MGDLRLEELVRVPPGRQLPPPAPLAGPPAPGSCSVQGGGSAGDSE